MPNPVLNFAGSLFSSAVYLQAGILGKVTRLALAQQQNALGGNFRIDTGTVATRPVHGDSLSVVWIIVAPVKVDGLLSAVQLNESTLFMVLGLVPLVRAVFIAVPGVIVLVALVVVALVVFALSVFLAPVFLRAGSGHHRNRCSKGSSQKK